MKIITIGLIFFLFFLRGFGQDTENKLYADNTSREAVKLFGEKTSFKIENVRFESYISNKEVLTLSAYSQLNKKAPFSILSPPPESVYKIAFTSGDYLMLFEGKYPAAMLFFGLAGGTLKLANDFNLIPSTDAASGIYIISGVFAATGIVILIVGRDY